nr:amidase family protein [Candidatus Eremiobacteraeota bacterium]
WPSQDAWGTLAVSGPMARTVEDVALFLRVLAGPDSRDPISCGGGDEWGASLQRDFAGTRVAWSADLGGLPVDPAVTAVLESQRGVFTNIGCDVEEASPDLSDADEVFQTLRAVSFVNGFDALLDQHPTSFKESVVWNVQLGRSLTGTQVGGATLRRSQIFARMHDFMETHEFLIAPVSQVVPFSVDREYPMEINGVKMHDYLEWMRSCSAITVTGHPAISVPCGFTPDGLPVGVQIIGRYRDELGLLQFAHAFEQRTRTGDHRPPSAGA